MRGAVLTAATFSLLVLGGLLWLEYVKRRELRTLEAWWAQRERTRGER